jgi:hypothetical protein
VPRDNVGLIELQEVSAVFDPASTNCGATMRQV